MGNKTKINGTDYEIIRGKTLIDYTTYKIKGGKTLVGGTNYDVEFLKDITLVIPSSMTGFSSVTIDGTLYSPKVYPDQEEKLLLPPGTIVECSVRCYNDNTGGMASISVNDEIVAQTQTRTPATYNYIVTADAIIEVTHSSIDGTLGTRGGTIIITEH